MTRDPRKALCDALATELASGPGSRISAWLRFTEAFGGPQETTSLDPGSAPAEVAQDLARKYLEGAPSPIGIWKPSSEGEGVAFLREESALTNDWWARTERLSPKASLLPLRVVLIGESTAAGWFYAPEITPARVLEAQLRAARGPRSFEVIDLTMVNLQPGALLELVGASLQLTPDVIVVFAGNNWPLRLASIDSLPPPDARGAALAFRDAGIPGLVRFADQRSRDTAFRVAETVARLSDASGVPVVVVVPEANLADWQRDRPVPWLPGKRAAEWHRAHREASGHAASGDGTSLCASARRMLELDSEVSSSSFRLLARGLEMLGEIGEAREAYLRALDLRSWDNVPSTPSATTGVRDALRASAGHGATVVDLEEIFRLHLGSRIPGRELFLDYCHLTLEGMKVAMAAAGAEVLKLTDPATAAEDWRTLLALSGRELPDAAVDGTAKLMTALYNAHYGSGHDVHTGRQSGGERGLVRHWLREAEKAWPEARELMSLYVTTRLGGPFTAYQQRWHRLLGRLHREAAMNAGLDPEVLEVLQEHLSRKTSFGEIVGEGVLDLSQPGFHWSVSDRYQEEAKSPQSLFYRGRWPFSHFCLPASGARGVQLDLTARLPRIGREREDEAELLVNGKAVARLSLRTGWERRSVAVAASDLSAGLNQITIAWPPLPAEGDEALAEIGRRLEEGIAADLHPRFGEIYALRARG
jgi:hypothetical protein